MKTRKKTKSFALALRLRARAATLLIALLCGVTGAWAQETLTVYDGTGTSQYIPMYGYSFDYYTKSECIIPASELTAMEGGTITAITFYAKTLEGSNTTFGTAKQKVFLKEVSGTTLSSYSGMDDATVVFDGTLPMPTTSASGYTITFSQGYTYNGGNLLIGIYNAAKGSWRKVFWYGNNNQSSGVSAFGYSAESLANVGKNNQTFLPKTTFTYTPAPTAVDLGLPSGKKWADMNVGAGSATGIGTYFEWGETTAYDNNNSYSGNNPTTLPLSNDAAYANWGSNWRMPTKTEYDELLNATYTTWTWYENYNSTGVGGYLVTSKTNGNSIFLPKTGYMKDGYLNAPARCDYWSSTINGSNNNEAYALGVGSGDRGTSNFSRSFGFAIRPVQMFAGEGTEASPYLIASTTDWNNLVSAVNGGETYSGKYFKMTASVGDVTPVSTWMTGTFSGTFDGDGKTLTVGYSNTTADVMCAPFGTLNGATIQKLKVAGSISSNQRFIAGIAAWCSSTGNNVTNCLVSATINSSYSGNAADGGLVSLVDDGASLNVTGCAFAGKMLTTNGTTSCGGIVGWRRSSGTVTITNCLYAPTSATGSETWIASAEGENGSANFCRWNSSEPTITNCYYTTDFGSGSYTAQGLQARSISAGDYVSTLSVTKGDGTEYDVSGITVYSGGIDFNDGSTTTFYGGSGQTVSLDLTAETRSGYHFKQYAASQGTLSGETTDTPTLTMPAANSTANDVVTISAEYDPLYTADFAQNIDDAEHWTISPAEAAEGETVSLAYTGTTHRVNSVTVMKEGEATETFETTKEVNNYTGTNVSIYAEHEGDNYGFNVHSDFATTISTTNGKNITSVVLTTGSGSVTPSNVTASPGTCTVSGNIVTITDINATSVSILSNEWGYIKVSQVDVTYPGFVPDNDVTVAWNGAENTGTFTMPAYDVVVSADMEIPTYNVTFADGNDNDDWMIDPEQQAVGGTVTVSYTGENKVKSVTVAPKGALTGKFSVSSTKQVQFSKGNLQYVGTWQFAANQYDIFGASQSDDHRDLFGWGTKTNPNNTSTTNGDYSWAEWGENTITNGCTGWRTLTKDEWGYLFTDRTNASTLRTFATVNNVTGLILMPDGWTASGVTLTITTANYTTNVLSTSQWATLEKQGCVFLPAAGGRAVTNVVNVGSIGDYWSSDASGDTNAYDLNFSNNYLLPQNDAGQRHYGWSVRLVRDVE